MSHIKLIDFIGLCDLCVCVCVNILIKYVCWHGPIIQILVSTYKGENTNEDDGGFTIIIIFIFDKSEKYSASEPLHRH